VPQFYSRDTGGIPVQWLNKIRESMATLTARFSSNRAVREYTEEYYLPAAAAYRQRSARKAGLSKRLVDRQTRLRRHWPELQFGTVDMVSSDEFHDFSVQVFPGGLEPKDIEVQLYAEPQAEGEKTNWPMKRGEPLPGPKPGHMYHAKVSASRPASDYSARIVPALSEASVPLEAPLILWQR
jgi:glycogen phosphorylase